MGDVKPPWLAELAPAHAPPPPGWWPPAPGWWVLAVLLLLACIAIWLWQRRPQTRMRRSALRELAQLESTTVDAMALAAALEHLVRRYAVARFGREAVAGLSGTRWINFVVAHGGADWGGTAGAALLQAAYGGAHPIERARWVSGARAFIKARK
jgi:HAMP domain-containing protein